MSRTILTPQSLYHPDRSVASHSRNAASRCHGIAVALFASLVFTALWLFSATAHAQALTAPSSLTAITYSKNQIDVQWNDPNPAEGGYVVERAKGTSSNWVEAYTSNANGTAWSNALLSPGISYSYRVRAFAVANGTRTYSAYSPIATATTQSSSYPDAPGGLVGAVAGDSELKLTWQNAGNASGYRVYRLVNNVWTAIGASEAPANYYLVSSLMAQTSYTFHVRAYNAAGESPRSNVVTLQTKSDGTAPTGSLTVNGGAAATNNPSITVALSASDAKGVTGYFLAAASTAPSANAAGWTPVGAVTAFNASASYSLSAGTGVKTIYAWYKDAAGNVSAPYAATITLDSTPPAGGTLTSSLVAPGQINLSWSGFSDVGSGVNPASYKLVYSVASSPSAGCGDGTVIYSGSATSFSHLTLAAGSTHYYRACVSDMTGNVAAGATATTTTSVGNSLPNPAGVKINQNAASTNSIDVTLNLGATDPVLVNAYYVSTSSAVPSATATGWIAVTPTVIYSANVPYRFVFVADGNKTVYVYFRNALGTVSQMYSDAIILDRTLPLNGSLAATAAQGQVTLSWSGFADGGSGLATPDAYTVVFAPGAAPSSCAAGTVIYKGGSTSFVHTGVSPGVAGYRVCAHDGAGNVSAGAVATPTVHANAAPIARAGPDQTGAAGGTIYFDVSGSSDTDGSIVSYAVSFGDGFGISSDNAGIFAHAYSTVGTYTMTVTVTDDKGLTSNDTATVTILPATASQGNLSSVKQFGGSGIDAGIATVVDGSGNVITSGYFQATINLGGGALTSAGASDVYIAKHTSTGTHICSLAIGGSGDEKLTAVAVDPVGNIVVTGSFQGSVNFGGTTLTSAGASDTFVAKYSSTCSTTAMWVRSFGSSTDDRGMGVAIDAAGDVVVTGFFTSNANFGGGTVQSDSPISDVFVVKYGGATGTFRWARTLMGVSIDSGRAVAIDAGGNVIVTGSFSQTISDETHPVLLTSSGSADAFIVKYSPTGASLWAKSFGGPGEDVPNGVTVDRGGNIVVIGSFENSIAFDAGSVTAAGLSDGFLAKFSPMGNYIWSTRFGSSGVDIGYAVATNAVGEVVLSGAVQSNDQQDIYVSKVSASGAVLWTKTFGSAENDVGYGIATDPAGNVVVTGYFQNVIDYGNGPMPSAGSSDAFVLKLTP